RPAPAGLLLGPVLPGRLLPAAGVAGTGAGGADRLPEPPAQTLPLGPPAARLRPRAAEGLAGRRGGLPEGAAAEAERERPARERPQPRRAPHAPGEVPRGGRRAGASHRPAARWLARLRQAGPGLRPAGEAPPGG